jgi:hypothetical protein
MTTYVITLYFRDGTDQKSHVDTAALAGMLQMFITRHDIQSIAIHKRES